MATMAWETNRGNVGQVMAPTARERTSQMRDKLNAVRDTLAVLAIQLVFRVMLLLRRWNY